MSSTGHVPVCKEKTTVENAFTIPKNKTKKKTHTKKQSLVTVRHPSVWRLLPVTT